MFMVMMIVHVASCNISLVHNPLGKMLPVSNTVASVLKFGCSEWIL